MDRAEDFGRYQVDPSDMVPEPPPDHDHADRVSASGENIDPDDDYPFSGLI